MSKKKPETQVDPSLIDEAMESVEKTSKSSKPSKDSGETYDRLVRLTADFENFRKRTQKEKADLVRYGHESLVRELLPILDNFERAVEHAEKSTDVDSIRTGVELILSQLRNALDRFGLATRSSKGEAFDPLLHEAVSQIETKDHPPNTIIEEHQKAYFLRDKLIRPALVTVSKSQNDPTTEQTEEISQKNDSEISDEKL